MKLTTFAAWVGVSRTVQFGYESGRLEPDVRYLAQLQQAGVDVPFLLTGRPTQGDLTEDETELLTKYRALDVRSKARMLDFIDGAQGRRRSNAGSIVAKNIGQQIIGNVYGDVTCAHHRKSSPKTK